MYTRFIERKLWAQKQEDVIDIMMFDESIRVKKLRKGGMLGIKRVRILTFQSYRGFHQRS
jgi:hypothetical protein